MIDPLTPDNPALLSKWDRSLFLANARALAQLAGLGVTAIHDITTPEQMTAFHELRRRGELTVRAYARPTLDRVEHLVALGIRPGFGDEWLKIGGLTGFVDGIMGNSTARFYEPYLTSGLRGSWRPMMEPAGNMERLLRLADGAGFWPQSTPSATRRSTPCSISTRR